MTRIIFVAAVISICAGCAAFPSPRRWDSVDLIVIPERMLLEGPQPSAPPGGVGVYFRDRANDFVDIFGFSLSLGIGALANVRVTQAIQCGGLFNGGARFGFIGRQAGSWSETETELGFPGFYLRSVQIAPAGGNIEPVDTERGQSLWQFLGDEGIPYDTGYDRKFWQVGATAHAVLVGVDFSINLKELLDFLLGWFTLDISRDDTANRPPEKKKPEKPYIPRELDDH